MKELRNCARYRADYCPAGAVCSIVGPPPVIELAIAAIASESGSGGKCWKLWFSNLRSSPMREDQAKNREDRPSAIDDARNNSIKSLCLSSTLRLSIKLTPPSRQSLTILRKLSLLLC